MSKSTIFTLINTQIPIIFLAAVGGGERIRTADPPLAKRMLYQLSYAPDIRLDSNPS